MISELRSFVSFVSLSLTVLMPWTRPPYHGAHRQECLEKLSSQESYPKGRVRRLGYLWGADDRVNRIAGQRLNADGGRYGICCRALRVNPLA